ncbi:hypothetical protein Val02_33430 [Virgisporangium aliadipatigenens]|uniref:Uncharacterized protein n=1 Tax=Virgisporangium aliadipatigenens TaxID=741659 RepID=A0A8J3YL79_9ACTN|nr:hypothetical protein [Virgisporangium aliadipatigenens]GIJ46457.1 hypothetical protein Val02_33430 [Virgisporangium aliadipatigenens]
MRAIPRVLLLLSAVALGLGLTVLPADAADSRASFLTHAQAAHQFRAAGITWSSSGRCDDRDNPRCTSFTSIRQSTVTGVKTLKRASGCPIHLTGGTETGHAAGTYSHWNGFKLDIRRNDCVDRYITAKFADMGMQEGWGHQFRAASGNLYTNEGRHWDIVYYTCGCA